MALPTTAMKRNVVMVFAVPFRMGLSLVKRSVSLVYFRNMGSVTDGLFF